MEGCCARGSHHPLSKRSCLSVKHSASQYLSLPDARIAVAAFSVVLVLRFSVRLAGRSVFQVTFHCAIPIVQHSTLLHFSESSVRGVTRSSARVQVRTRRSKRRSMPLMTPAHVVSRKRCGKISTMTRVYPTGPELRGAPRRTTFYPCGDQCQHLILHASCDADDCRGASLWCASLVAARSCRPSGSHDRSLGKPVRFQISPQRNQQLARQRDDANAADALFADA